MKYIQLTRLNLDINCGYFVKNIPGGMGIVT